MDRSSLAGRGSGQTGAFPCFRCSIALLLCLLAAGGRAEEEAGDSLTVRTEKLELTFSPKGAVPVRWRACFPDCNRARDRVDFVFAHGTQPVKTGELVLRNAAELNRTVNTIRYSVKRWRTERFVVLQFLSQALESGVYIQKTFQVSRRDYEIGLTVRVLGSRGALFAERRDAGVILAAGEDFAARRGHGFSGGHEKPDVVTLVEGRVSSVDPPEAADEPHGLGAFQWLGVRNRFWGLLAHVEGFGGGGWIMGHRARTPTLLLFGGKTSPPATRVRFFAGPIEFHALASVSDSLSDLLFSHLWFWLRWLCFALLFILSALYRWIGSYGIAIMAMALVVKFLMAPLTAAAERWQRRVNETEAKLKPLIDDVKKRYKGEEQVERILAIYKNHDVHPLYSLNSLFGFLIQIPVFIAAYAMLSENFALQSAGFLWVKDLSQPDHFLKLPFTVPFFGNYLNLLPFLMTAVTLLASLLFDARSLSPELIRRQKRNLYLMALLFFVLFYTFPAGMVLYWTSTNLIQFVKDQLLRAWRLSGRGAVN